MKYPEPLLIIGAGEHARVVVDAAQLLPDRWQIAGIIASNGESFAAELGVEWLADDKMAFPLLADAAVVLGVGQIGINDKRQQIVHRYQLAGAQWATIIHPKAIISSSAKIHIGTVVLAGVVVNPHSQIGCHTIVNTRSVVEHDVSVGDFACLAPGCVIGGGVRIGSGSFIGLGACVRDHLRIGESALIGMGSVVTRDVATRHVVIGNPARQLSLS
jgi:acetyltransferase EpsM